MTDKEMKKLLNQLRPIGFRKMCMMTGRHDLRLNVPYGGGSFTDGRGVTVGIPEFTLESNPGYKEASKKAGMKFTFMEVWMMGMALLIHETSHLLFSSFNQFKKFQDWAIMEFSSLEPKLSPKGKKMLPLVVRRIAAQLNNALEDGRCEHFVVNKYPGSAKYLKFLNGTFWKMADTPAKSNVVNLMMCLCYLATSGVDPQYYDKLDQELRDNVDLVRKDVAEFINIAGPLVATKKLQKIILKLKPYLEKLLLVEIEDAATMQEIMELLAEFVDFQNKNALERPDSDLDGDSLSVHISVPGKSGKGNGKGQSGKKSDKKEDGSGSGAGKDGEDGESKDGEGKDDKDGKDGKDKSKDSSSGEEGKDYSKDPFAAKREAPDHAERGGSEDGEDSSGQNADNNGQGTSSGNKQADGSTPDINEVNEAVKAEIDRAIEEGMESASKEYTAQSKKVEAEESASEDLSSADIESIREGYDDPHVEGYDAVNVNVSLPAPDDIRKQGRMLRKQLEAFFREQEAFDLADQHSGRLNKKAIHRVGTNDFRIFEKKGNPLNVDSCVSIVWDGSGSMCGSKQKLSTMACAIIEEALKPLMPMKITNFTTEGNCVKHFQVKKFEDRDPVRNYAYSYGSSRSFSGGNKDGYSIKVATAELMKRSEQNKILLVLSDGLPSDYRSHAQAIGDVKTAVKNARKAGIKVIAIFFGDEGFRRNTMDEYKEMYEKNLISCAPQDISKELVKQVRMLLMQK